MKLRYIYLLAIAASLFSCKPEMKDGFLPQSGGVDFSTYVAVGNSLTAGYADGALYHTGQKNGWANILAKQLKEVGGGDFVQPVVNSEQGVLPGKLSLAVVNGSLVPVPAQDGDLEGFYPPVGYAVNNLGVPGAKVGHLLANGFGNIQNVALGLANPYFVRFASSPDISVAEQAVSMQPTFFSLWIGNNDVLGYAASGGLGDAITPEAQFTAYYTALTQALASTGAKGVLANIPSVTSAAYFNTVPPNALVIDAATAMQLNFGIASVESQINAILEPAGLPHYSYGITFTPGANGFLIQDNDFPYKDLLNAIADTTSSPVTKVLLHQVQFRQIDVAGGELLTLKTPQDSLALGMGSFMTLVEGLPPLPFGIPDVYVLDKNELANVQDAISAYNSIIKNIADQNGWAFVDIHAKFDEMKGGVTIDGVDLDAEYVAGGIFSLDGIHLTPRGNAAVANFFVDAINKKYGSKISTVNVSEYPAVTFPND